MSYDKPIILRGLWRPTDQEIKKLREYKTSRTRNRPKTLYVPGRQIISLELTGRNPVKKLLPGVDYFITIEGRMMSDHQRVRRVVKVYPSDDELPQHLPNVDLDYLVRPITVLEAWRATREPIALIRSYRKPGGGQDRMRPGREVGTFRVEMHYPADQAWMGKVTYQWNELQSRLDTLDMEKDHVERPDWKLVAPLGSSR